MSSYVNGFGFYTDVRGVYFIDLEHWGQEWLDTGAESLFNFFRICLTL